MRRPAFVALATMMTFGCGGRWALAPGGSAYIDPPREHDRAGLMHLDWHRRMSTAMSQDFRPVYRGSPTYDAARGNLYVGSIDNGLYAIRARDGSIVWRFETLGRVDSTATVDDELVTFGSADGALYALDTRDGRMRWRVPTAANIVHEPLVFNGAVYFVNANDTVMSVNRSDGQVRWRYRRNAPGGISLSGHAGLARLGNHLFAAFSDGVVACLDAADGSVVWNQDTSADIENVEERNEAHDPIDVDTTPLVLNDAVYVASFTAGVYSMDVATGNRNWRLDNVLHVSGLGTDGRYLYAASAVSGLVKIDPFDGTVVWARDLGSTALMAPQRLAPTLMLVPMADRGLWIVRSSDGEPIDGLAPGSGFNSEAEIDGNRLFLESNAGVLYAFDLRTR